MSQDEQMNDVETLPRLTRKQAVQFLNGRGIPVTLHGLIEAVRHGEGPRPSCKWGRLFLYEPKELLSWAEKRLRPCLPNAYPNMNGIEGRGRTRA